MTKYIKGLNTNVVFYFHMSVWPVGMTRGWCLIIFRDTIPLYEKNENSLAEARLDDSFHPAEQDKAQFGTPAFNCYIFGHFVGTFVEIYVRTNFRIFLRKTCICAELHTN